MQCCLPAGHRTPHLPYRDLGLRSDPPFVREEDEDPEALWILWGDAAQGWCAMNPGNKTQPNGSIVVTHAMLGPFKNHARRV